MRRSTRQWPADPQSVSPDQRGLLLALPRPKLNSAQSTLPDPDADLGAYLHECRTRMRRAVARFSVRDIQLGALEKWFIDSMEGRIIEAGIQMEKDGTAKMLFAQKNYAMTHVHTYALAIQAEVALQQLLSDKRT